MYRGNEIHKNEIIRIEKCGLMIYECCTFENCHFVIKNPYELVLYNNVYKNCTFDVDLSHTVDIHFGDNEIKYLLKDEDIYNIFNKTVGTPVLPEGKTFVGYKILHSATNERWAIVKLRIPKDAYRSCAGIQNKRKCRASSVYVEAIYEIKGIHTNKIEYSDRTPAFCPALVSNEMDLVPITEFYNSCFNAHGYDTNYVVGKEIKADEWDSNRFAECTHGIHFFLNLKSAIVDMAYFISDLQRDKIIVEFNKKERGE